MSTGELASQSRRGAALGLSCLHAANSRVILVPMSEVTRILSAIEHGDKLASEQLLPLVYAELRQIAAAKLAHEKPGQTLQATSLVHEAYIRLVVGDAAQRWDSRAHFFAAAAEAMRRILINRARDRGVLKRGGDRRRIDFDDITDPLATSDADLLDLNDALEQLGRDFPQAAQLVQLRFFGGLTLDDAASALDISARTADRQWAFARAWLLRALSAE
jgi:RNA polymerase sigma factor (TIGR02999 family)